MDTIAVIPARAGSKRIKNKNLIDFCGKPLIHWTIKAAIDSNVCDKIVVSTDSLEIAKIAEEAGADVPFLRPKELAADDSTTLSVIHHAVRFVERETLTVFDNVLLLQPTSPLRSGSHIKKAIALFNSNLDADSLVSCVKINHSFHPDQLMSLSDRGFLEHWNGSGANFSNLNQGKNETIFARNGAAIYITRRNKIAEYIVGGRVLLFKMSPMHSIDIDEAEDLEMAKIIFTSQAKPS